jgi:hypothetical protein
MNMGSQIVAIGGLRVGVWLHTHTDPTQAEWAASCEHLAGWLKSHRDGLEVFRVFVVTDGGTPDARQRRELYKDTLNSYATPVAVVSEVVAQSPLKRGIATALSWMNPNVRVFDPTDVFSALEHVGLEADRMGALLACLEALQVDLEPNTSLNVIRSRAEAVRPSLRPLAAEGDAAWQARLLSRRSSLRPVAGSGGASSPEEPVAPPSSMSRTRAATPTDSERARKA